MELDPFAHPAKVPAIASKRHAPQQAVFLAISIPPQGYSFDCFILFSGRFQAELQ
jgi:hypothetical protein